MAELEIVVIQLPELWALAAVVVVEVDMELEIMLIQDLLVATVVPVS